MLENSASTEDGCAQDRWALRFDRSGPQNEGGYVKPVSRFPPREHRGVIQNAWVLTSESVECGRVPGPNKDSRPCHSARVN